MITSGFIDSLKTVGFAIDCRYNACSARLGFVVLYIGVVFVFGNKVHARLFVHL